MYWRSAPYSQPEPSTSSRKRVCSRRRLRSRKTLSGTRILNGRIASDDADCGDEALDAADCARSGGPLRAVNITVVASTVTRFLVMFFPANETTAQLPSELELAAELQQAGAEDLGGSQPRGPVGRIDALHRVGIEQVVDVDHAAQLTSAQRD